MAYGLSNGQVIDDVTWPPKVLWGSTVGYPSDSLASCYQNGCDSIRVAFWWQYSVLYYTSEIFNGHFASWTVSKYCL